MIETGSTFYFAPQDPVQEAIVQFAANEKTELCIGAYALTLKPLLAQVKANHAAGITQYVLCDLSQEQGHYEHPEIVDLIDSGIDVVIGTAPSGNILHSKYLLGKSQQAVFTGSYNFSASAAVQNNCSQTFTGLDVWTQFRSHFDEARSWCAAHEPQDQIKKTLVAKESLRLLSVYFPARFAQPA